MNLIVRSVQSIARQALKPRLGSVNEESVDAFRVLPLDIDVYRHMNNARYLNYLEASRWGLTVRAGFFKLALERGWITPIGTLTIDYYRPLTLGQRFEVRSRFVGFDAKWFYILQRLWRGEKEVARALVKMTVRQGRTAIRPEEYLTALGFDGAAVELPDEVAKWIAARIDLRWS